MSDPLSNDFDFDSNNDMAFGDSDFDFNEESHIGELDELEDISMREANLQNSFGVPSNQNYMTEIVQNQTMQHQEYITSFPPHLRVNSFSNASVILQHTEAFQPNIHTNPPNLTNHVDTIKQYSNDKPEIYEQTNPELSTIKIPKKNSSSAKKSNTKTAAKKSTAKKATSKTESSKDTSKKKAKKSESQQKEKIARDNPISQEEKPKKRLRLVDINSTFPQNSINNQDKPHSLTMHERFYLNPFLINGYDLSKYPSEVPYIPQKKDKVYLFRKCYNEWVNQLYDTKTLWDKIYISPFFKDEKWPFENLDVIEAKIVGVKHEAHRVNSIVKLESNEQITVSIVKLKMIQAGTKIPFEMKYAELVGQVEWILHKPLVLAALQRFKEIESELKKDIHPIDSVKYDGIPARGTIEKINCSSNSSNIDSKIEDLWASLTLNFDDGSTDNVSPWELDSTNLIFKEQFKSFYSSKFISAEAIQFAIQSFNSILGDPSIQLPLLTQSIYHHPYPLSIHTIIERLSHTFYSSKASFLFDINHLSKLLKKEIENANAQPELVRGINIAVKAIKDIKKKVKGKKKSKEQPLNSNNLPPHLNPKIIDSGSNHYTNNEIKDQVEDTSTFDFNPNEMSQSTKITIQKKSKSKDGKTKEKKIKEGKKEEKVKKDKKKKKEKKQKENIIKDITMKELVENTIINEESTSKIKLRMEPKKTESPSIETNEEIPPHLAPKIRIRTESKTKQSRLKSLAPAPVIPPQLIQKIGGIEQYIPESNIVSPFLQSYNKFIENVQAPKNIIPPRFRTQQNEKRFRTEHLAKKNLDSSNLSYLSEYPSEVSSLNINNETKHQIEFIDQTAVFPNNEKITKLKDSLFEWNEQSQSIEFDPVILPELLSNSDSQSDLFEKIWESQRKVLLTKTLYDSEEYNEDTISSKSLNSQIPVCIPIQKNFSILEITNDSFIVLDNTKNQIEFNNSISSSKHVFNTKTDKLTIDDLKFVLFKHSLKIIPNNLYKIFISVEISPSQKRHLKSIPNKITEYEHIFQVTERIHNILNIDEARHFLSTFGYLSKYKWSSSGFFYSLVCNELHIVGIPGMTFIVN